MGTGHDLDCCCAKREAECEYLKERYSRLLAVAQLKEAQLCETVWALADMTSERDEAIRQRDYLMRANQDRGTHCQLFHHAYSKRNGTIFICGCGYDLTPGQPWMDALSRDDD